MKSDRELQGGKLQTVFAEGAVVDAEGSGLTSICDSCLRTGHFSHTSSSVDKDLEWRLVAVGGDFPLMFVSPHPEKESVDFNFLSIIQLIKL